MKNDNIVPTKHDTKVRFREVVYVYLALMGFIALSVGLAALTLCIIPLITIIFNIH